METAYFISVGFYWITALICSLMVRAESKRILDFYTKRWNMDVTSFPSMKTKPSINTAKAIISSFIPIWNVFSALFMIVGVRPMKERMWKIMQDADVSHYY